MNIACPSCGKQISESSERCPFCHDDLDAHTPRPRPNPTPDPRAAALTAPLSYILGGFVIAMLSVILASVIELDTTAGVLVAIIGGVLGQIFILIGVIAKGVQVGIRANKAEG